jgi:hypothetical protein
MADISMCSGEGCPFKDTCYRHTAPKSLVWQSYFTEPPIIKGEEITCEYYWENEKDEGNNRV